MMSLIVALAVGAACVGGMLVLMWALSRPPRDEETDHV